MIVESCQRWELGRAFKRPAGEVIRPRAEGYEVVRSENPMIARRFVDEHHYSGTSSPPMHPYEIRRRGEFVGVALFGPAPSMNAHRDGRYLLRWAGVHTLVWYKRG